MRSIFNMLLLIAATVTVLVIAGVITEDDLLNLLGEVQEGETTQSYTEGEFEKAFDIIVGRVEVADTSRTEFKRNIAVCEPGYVVYTTNAVIEYQVRTSPETYYFDVKKKEYYISPDLGVTYVEVDRQTKMDVEESYCVKKRHINADMISSAQRKAEAALKKAIQNSDKMENAYNEFEAIKQNLIQRFDEAGFVETLPPTTEDNSANLD